MILSASRLLGGVVLVGAGLLAVSGVAHGIDSRPLAPAPAPHAEARILVAQAEGTKVTFTAEQVERGKKVFGEDCAECHGKDLRGGLIGGPPLRGLAFEARYGKGQPAGALYGVMQGTMPPNAPGSYSPGTYADLMAYILKTNGYKAGAELPADADKLFELVIDK